MIIKLLTEHHLEFQNFKGGCRGSSEHTLVKMPYCWKSHVAAQLYCLALSRETFTGLIPTEFQDLIVKFEILLYYICLISKCIYKDVGHHQRRLITSVLFACNKIGFSRDEDSYATQRLPFLFRPHAYHLIRFKKYDAVTLEDFR